MVNKDDSIMVILSSPSGAGKTTISKKIQQKYQNFKISVSHTTRRPRPNEVEGVDYFFLKENQFKDKLINLNSITNKMEKLTITPSKITKFGVNIAKDGVSRSAGQILSQKGVNMNKIREIWPEITYFSKEIDDQLEINAHYRGYLKKQNADILAFKRDENLIIPTHINYDVLSGLSNEVKLKFKQIKPKTMGQALRIDGITPAAVYILLSHVKRKSIKHIA